MPGAEEASRRIFERRHRMIAALIALAQNAGSQLEAAGKRPASSGGASWTDRTGHARQGLFHDVVFVDDQIRLRYAHTVDYGVFLELANSGKYAELEPRVKDFAPGFFANAERIVKSQ
jgi:hypothetical protein